MTKNLVIANAIIVFYIVQRITEMVISKENERWLKENCHAVEVDKSEGIKMKIFHSLWFISLLLETNIKNDIQNGMVVLVIYPILALAMGIRFYSIERLKRFWTIKIFSLDEQVVVTDGLYKFIRHPNYLVVIIEFLLLPFLFKAYLTMGIFSVLNLLVLSQRIKLEESTLMGQSNYDKHFKGIKRLVPYVFILMLMIHPLRAAEINHKFKNYEEAKVARDYIQFEGASTKFGLITTNFMGYARDFKISYDLVNNQLNSLEVIIPTASLDTDVESRNEKMVNAILSKETFPEIRAAILEKVKLTAGDQVVNMVFTVKDHKVTKPVSVSIKTEGDKFIISGKTTIGLKELNLPDPSIVIAKVRDDFNLTFSVLL